MAAIPTTLPASWYCSQGLHQLERRAVFLRCWFFLGILNKFEDGINLRFEIAQVPLIAKTANTNGDKIVRVINEETVSLAG